MLRMCFFVVVAMISLLSVEKARAQCDGIGFLILRSSVIPEEVYHPFVEGDCVRQGKVVFATVDYNPFTANQIRDLAKIKDAAVQLSSEAPRGTVVLAYSEAGKFAAKIASLNTSIKALFLMDPVDGTPPFSSPKRFPIFLDETFPKLQIPAMILESELGPSFKRLGHSCVTQEMGPKRFYRHVEGTHLQKIFMAGLGHADFLQKDGFNPIEMLCGGGILPKETAFALVLAHWTRFVEQVAFEL